MCPVLMVIERVGSHQPFEMPLIQDDHVVKEIASATAHPAFSNTVLPRTAKGRASWLAPDVPHCRTTSALRLGRIARICAAACRPMLLAVAVQAIEHWVSIPRS